MAFKITGTPTKVKNMSAALDNVLPDKKKVVAVKDVKKAKK